MADNESRRALTGFPAVQEPRDTFRSLQQTVINIRERLRQIEEQVNLDIGGGNGITGNPFPDAPADGNTYGRRNRAWTIVKQSGLRFTYDTEPPDVATGSPGDEWMEADTSILYTLVDDGSHRQWVELAGVGLGAPASAVVHVDIYDAPGSYTWTKPAGAVCCEIVVVGGGGGGAGGSSNGTGYLTYSGGSGGGGGAFMQAWVPASELDPTEPVVVASGGAGGAALGGGPGTFSGNPGSDGGASSFAGLTAYGGGGGRSGAGSSSTGGAGGGAASGGVGDTEGAFGGIPGAGSGFSSYTPNPNLSVIGGASGAGQINGVGIDGGLAMGGGQGGGSGGSSTSTPGPDAGDFGGDAFEWGKWAASTVPAATTTADSFGLSGIAPSLRGAGGPGGKGCCFFAPLPVRGRNAGHGQQPGGGGGGGGGVTSGPPSGAGGSGGAGIVVVVTYMA